MPDFFPEIPERQLKQYRALSIGLASLAFCIGGAALMGWIFKVDALKRIHPALVTMKANTAVCLMLVAVSVFLVQDSSASPIKRRLALVLAAIVATVGLIPFSEHVFGWNSGLDQLLFHESVAEAGESFPGRMGIASSLNFVFFGLALSFLDARSTRWFRSSTISILAIVTSTLLVFLYYFYGIEHAEPLARYFTIAIHTVVAFLSLCGAILLARPDRDLVATFLGKSPGAVVARRMLPAFLVVILLGWIRTIARSNGWISQGFATAAFVIAILLLLGILIWLTALSLNRTDRVRRLVDLANRRAENRVDVLFRVSELISTLNAPS